MAENEIKASIVVDLDEKGVVVGARNITKSVDQMTKKMINDNKKVTSQYRGMGKELNSSVNQMKSLTTQAVAIYGGKQAIKSVWEFNDTIEALGRKLGKSAEEMAPYKDALYKIQWQFGVAKDAMNSYADEVANGNITMDEFIEKMYRAGIASKALKLPTGEELKNYHWLLKEFNVESEEGLQNRVANIADQGRYGANQLISGAYQIMPNWQGKKDQGTLYDIMSMIQAMSGDYQNEGDAVADLNAFISDLSSQRKFIKDRLGKDIFTNVDGKLQLNDLQPIIDMLSGDTKDGEWLKGLWYDQHNTLKGKLSDGGARVVSSLSGKGDQIKEIKNSQGVNAEQLALDRSRSFASSMEKLTATLERFADMNLAEPIEKFALALSQLEPEDIQNIMEGVKEGLIGLGATLAVFKGSSVLSNLKIGSVQTASIAAVAGITIIKAAESFFNQRLDEDVKRTGSIEDRFAQEVAIPYRQQFGESINFNDVNDVIKRLDAIMKYHPKMTDAGFYNTAISELIDAEKKRTYESFEGAASFVGGFSLPHYKDQERLLNQLDKGKTYGISPEELAEHRSQLEESIRKVEQLEAFKKELLKPQQVNTQVNVKVEADKGIRVVSQSQHSEVSQKRGFMGDVNK